MLWGFIDTRNLWWCIAIKQGSTYGEIFECIAINIRGAYTMPTVNDSTQAVVIIGMGAAGLAAAERLTRLGIYVRLVEARSRIGGRIHSIQLGGATVEAGAAWREQGSGNPMDPYFNKARDKGVTLENINTALHILKPKIFLGDELISLENAQKLINAYDDLLIEVLRNTSDDIDLTHVNTLYELIIYMAEKKGLDVENDDFKMMLSFGATINEHLMGSSIRELPLAYVLDKDEKIAFRDAPANKKCFYRQDDPRFKKKGPGCFVSDESLIIGGYNKVCQAILDQAKANPGHLEVLLSHEVIHISLSDSVTVTCHHKTKGENVDITGAYLINTMPLGVLQQFSANGHFSPPLCEKKQEALSRTKLGCYNKVMLRFNKIFWDKNVKYLYLRDQHSKSDAFAQIVNLAAFNEEPILILSYSGEDALIDANMTDEQVSDHFLGMLKQAYGEDKVTNPTDIHVTRWHEDPYSLGSWTAPTVNEEKDDLVMISRPEQRQYFAGEHTSSFHSTHNAFDTGLQVAAQVYAQLKKTNST